MASFDVPEQDFMVIYCLSFPPWNLKAYITNTMLTDAISQIWHDPRANFIHVPLSKLFP